MKKVLYFLLKILICAVGITIGHLISEAIEEKLEEKRQMERIEISKKRKSMKQRVDDFSNRHYITIKLVDLHDIRGRNK